MAYINDLGGYQQRFWSLQEILKNNLCLHLDVYPRNKGPLPAQILSELRRCGWIEKVKRTGLRDFPTVRFICPPGIGPDDGVQD